MNEASSTDIVTVLLSMTEWGAEWVLWLLIALSVLSISIIFERAFYFWRSRLDFSSFSQNLGEFLSTQQFEKAIWLCENSRSSEALVALKGLQNREKGASAVEHLMEGFALSQKQKWDRGLVVLGTLGNNAPFIGLFGTVIGIIKAFRDLSVNPQGGASVVMSGISEALVATAVGLLVAIPAVIAFNAFSRMVKKRVAHSQAIIKMITALSV
ncbi:MAG: MotA/TolQ/ExbB proton channel family protein [Oligoflexales bacterium]|nr:MotA/TolQ/ExbB proton channel family protein [Oligoflexales bacterium]